MEDRSRATSWRSGRRLNRKFFAYLILTCDDRAATTLQSVDATKDDRGLAAFKALQDKYGDSKRAQLSKLIKKFFKRKQLQHESAADYLNDVKALLSEIEKYDAKKIWAVMKTTTVLQHMHDGPEGELVKKLQVIMISNRMAKAEADGKLPSYSQIEPIVETRRRRRRCRTSPGSQRRCRSDRRCLLPACSCYLFLIACALSGHTVVSGLGGRGAL